MAMSAVVTENQKWLGRVAVLLAFGYVTAVSLATQGAASLGPALGVPGLGASSAAGLTAAQGLALGMPLAILGLAWPTPRYRAIFQSWAVAASFLLLLSLSRLAPATQGQLAAVVQLAMTVVFIVGMWLLARGPGRVLPAAEPTGLFLALAIGMAFAIPWIAQGALGSPLDALLALALGLAFGAAVAQVLSRFWLPVLEVDSRGPARDTLTGGFVAGTALLIMAGGLGINGLQLALMLALPCLGFAAIGLAGLGRAPASAANRRSMALLLGVAAAAPLLFVDSDGMAVQVLDSILGEAYAAVGAATVIGWLAGLLMVGRSRQLAGFRPSAAWPALAGALAVGAVVVYATGGQTGFHGDRLFVILKEQADVSAAAEIADYDVRRQTVYQQLTGHAAANQTGLRRALDRLRLGYTPYYLVNGLEVRGGLPVRLWLATRPEVDRVLPSPRLRPANRPPAEARGQAARPEAPAWNLTSIGADRAWEELGVRGAGIVVGQSDSGAEWRHDELRDAYRGAGGQHDANWLDPWNGTAAPVDANGHGTHTLGSVLGNRTGVAPDATWFGCANLYRNLGNPALYLDCLQFMLAPYPPGGDPLADGDPLRSAHVLNNSWGCPQAVEGCDPASLQPAVDALRAAGLFVVASAGNEGPACSTLEDPLALYDSAFTVGAIDVAGNLAFFSSRGPVLGDGSGRTKPDIVAPGVDVLSAYPGNSYEASSGTSMAGPHVAGVVALMWSANPTLIGDIEATEEILTRAAWPFTGSVEATVFGLAPELEGRPEAAGELAVVGQPGIVCGRGLEATPNDYAGYGVLDAYAAVQLALAAGEP